MSGGDNVASSCNLGVVCRQESKAYRRSHILVCKSFTQDEVAPVAKELEASLDFTGICLRMSTSKMALDAEHYGEEAENLLPDGSMSKTFSGSGFSRSIRGRG